MVVEVRNETHAPHLVALAKIPEDGWYLFNDFVVQRVSEAEVLSFSGTWKVIIRSITLFILNTNEELDTLCAISRANGQCFYTRLQCVANEDGSRDFV
jgi:hypothetical protein